MNSDPKHPEFILIPPPTEPGIHDKNSKPDKPFSQAKSETFLSKDEQPAINLLSSISDILLKFLPNLIKIFSPKFSLIKRLDPAPKTCFLYFGTIFRKLISSFKFSRLKKTFAEPPIFIQFKFLREKSNFRLELF